MTNTTMNNLETWVRQLNGELKVSDYSRPKDKPVVSEYIKEFRVSLNVNNKCQWTLTNGSYSTKSKPNVRFIFDAKNYELKSIEFLKGSYYD